MSSPAAVTLTLVQARAVWAAKQRLGAPCASPAAALVATGYVRSLGGADPYLALFARTLDLTPKKLEGAVARGAVRVAPAVRGCMYLVPRCDVALLLRTAEPGYRKRMDRDLAKAGATPKEVEALQAAVLSALAAGPLTTAAVRAALPDGAARSLGAAGKKVGMSSALPAALRYLELEGRVERTPVALDTEQYLWGVSATDPFAGTSVPGDQTARLAALLERFLRWAGPARLDDFVTWAGCGKREAAAAAAAVAAVPVGVEGLAADALLLASDLPGLSELGANRTVSLLPFEDNLLALHGGPGPLVDPAHHARPVQQWGRAGIGPLGEARHIHRRPLVVGGEMVGLWEFDPDTRSVVSGSFSGRAVWGSVGASKAVAAFLASIGHGRAFSLDTDDALRERAAEIRQMR